MGPFALSHKLLGIPALVEVLLITHGHLPSVSKLAQADVLIFWQMTSDIIRHIFILRHYENKWVLKFSKECVGFFSKVSGESGRSDLVASKQFSAFEYDQQEHMKLISKYKVVFSDSFPKGIIK